MNETFFTPSLCSCARVNSVPQSEETRAELSQIAWVPRQVIHSFRLLYVLTLSLTSLLLPASN